jgi:hypothetical protein
LCRPDHAQRSQLRGCMPPGQPSIASFMGGCHVCTARILAASSRNGGIPHQSRRGAQASLPPSVLPRRIAAAKSPAHETIDRHPGHGRRAHA